MKGFVSVLHRQYELIDLVSSIKTPSVEDAVLELKFVPLSEEQFDFRILGAYGFGARPL